MKRDEVIFPIYDQKTENLDKHLKAMTKDFILDYDNHNLYVFNLSA